MITLNSISKSFADRELFSDLSLRILPGEKLGLIGANGTGKSTIMKIIAGEESVDAGEVIYDDSSISIASFAQLSDIKQYNTLYDEVKTGILEYSEYLIRLREAECELAAAADSPELLEKAMENYSAIREKYELLGGDDIEWKINRVLLGLGFSLSDKTRYVSEFSGGWKMRIDFAKLLLKESDLLLLDEPTNHLDLKAIDWLESYIAEYSGAVLIVSHDRYFLNQTVSSILSLSGGKLRRYIGGYDDYIKQRNEELELQERAYKNQQKQLQHDLRFIERFRYKATLATRVKSREKAVAKRELIEQPLKQDKSISLVFDYDKREMASVFTFKNLVKEFPTKRISFAGEVEIHTGDRVALTGENGSGKTTLLNILSGRDRQFKGILKVHPAVSLSYYLQNQEMVLHPDWTVYDELANAAPDRTVTGIRTMLAAFLFKGDDVFKKVGVLSGGERVRLALAITVASPSNVILLDEPVNHLDIDSREALAAALDQYDGTMIIVAHDRYFIDQLCNRVFEIKDDKLSIYEGDYSYYHECIAKKIPIASDKKRAEVQKKKIKLSAKRSAKGEHPITIESLELQIQEKEHEKSKLEAAMCESENISNLDKLNILLLQYQNIVKELDNLWDKYYLSEEGS